MRRHDGQLTDRLTSFIAENDQNDGQSDDDDGANDADDDDDVRRQVFVFFNCNQKRKAGEL